MQRLRDQPDGPAAIPGDCADHFASIGAFPLLSENSSGTSSGGCASSKPKERLPRIMMRDFIFLPVEKSGFKWRTIDYSAGLEDENRLPLGIFITLSMDDGNGAIKGYAVP
jgi:hypothetical protein